MFDSIRQSFKYEPKFLVKMDARNAFVTNTYSKMNGVKIGLSYRNTTRIGIGYNWMKEMVLEDSSNTYLKFGYVAPFFEYVFYKSKHWFGEIPVQMGIGRARYRNKLENITETGTWMFVYEPAMTLEYRFFKYFGIGGGAGIRLIIKGNDEVTHRFTSPIYILRFKIYFGDIYNQHIRKERAS